MWVILMIDKRFVETSGGNKARVTFTLPNVVWADVIYLVGDFNDWNCCTHPLRQARDGTWSITIELNIGRVYQFRYLIDGHQWTNDEYADAYVHNLYGGDNFVVITDPAFRPYRDQRTTTTEATAHSS